MSVLLGLSDAEVGDGIVDWSTTKIGGQPNWMPTIGMGIEWPKCHICQASCTFIVQIYCPIGDSLFHRTLYIFACRKKECWNKPESWCVIRNQHLETTDKVTEVKPTRGEESIDWGCDADDWAVDEDDWGDGAEGGLSEQLHQMVLNTPDITQPDNGAPGPDEIQRNRTGTNTPVFSHPLPTAMEDFLLVPLYIAVIEEPCEKEDTPFSHESKLMKDYAKQEGIDLNSLLDYDSMETGGGQEKYEKSETPHGDAIFQKFKKRILRCPQQIMRYEYGGQPVNLKKPQMVKIPPCHSCGQPRIFEVQLMPSLINHLRFQKQKEEVVEFGTVQIYTCQASCWDDQNCRKEFIIIQDDPDQHLFS